MQPHATEWEAAVEEEADAPINALLATFGEEETRLRERCLVLAFREKDEEGNQIKRTGEEVQLQLTSMFVAPPSKMTIQRRLPAAAAAPPMT